jgi:hypothetical protein
MSTKYNVQPFTIHFSDEELADMMNRLRHTRYPDDFGNDDWRYGYNTDYHRKLVEYWVN